MDELSTALQLSEGNLGDDEDISLALLALLTSATRDTEPKATLSELHHLITRSGATSHLDPLNALPLLLPCNDPAARDIIAVIGECGPAKEVVMAVQEAVEHLEHILDSDNDNDDQRGDDSIQPARNFKLNSPTTQLTILIDIYGSSISRMKMRRNSAPDILRPLLKDLQAVIQRAAPTMTTQEGRSIISGIAMLCQKTTRWAETVVGDKHEGTQTSKEILKGLLNQAIVSCGHCIRASVAQRTFEVCYPRLTIRSSQQPGWEEGEKVILDAIEVYSILGCNLNQSTGDPSIADLMIAAYRPSLKTDPDVFLPFILPVLISSIQTNSFLDESLAILTRTLHLRQLKTSPSSLPPRITVPLCGLLPAVASIHADPLTRHQAFRVLSLLLVASEPLLRFQHLLELTGDSEFPQMRVASVGLVKETLLQGLSVPQSTENIFLTPLFLRSFGPILFRPNPSDLFTSANLTYSEFQDSHEPQRLVECLSLYYVLLLRDKSNLTGVRDPSVLKTVDTNLLIPLRGHLERWSEDTTASTAGHHAITPIVSLSISLERVDAARASLLVHE
ncbi:hypothetical protein BYT27DRAFT_7103611 [Phlegmacium glaucopus]|nr:hypothetical protein BYT27DRAFT_7103611 [Phlegmacium glaucopus]